MNPFISPLDSILIPTYWVIMSLTHCVGFIFFYRRSLQKNLSAKIASELAIIIMISGFIGARAFHILFEFPDYYYEYPSEIFKFWNGGFVFYGGFIFAFIFGTIYLKKFKQNITPWLDALTPAIALSYALGRVGCLLSGCCYGLPSDLPWAITFPVGVEAPPLIRLHPTQVYSALMELIILLILLLIERKNSRLGKGKLFSIWMILHGLARFGLEQFRGDYRGFDLLGFSISSVISLLIIATGLITLVKIQKSNDHS